ncbi:hypothetical protein AVEN_98835-1 [Araneus ventricosus]|uniref:Uncharacterized protein n=1 Tax=Araneus ventricosus TaxID=182803 RepID=A0A4Y2PKE6_ARAVE|nr:hypothetical protein AVEN_98835-1 [Araneus ventricosus]
MEAAYFGGFLFVLPISGYATLGELVLYAVSLMLKESMDSEDETCAPEDNLAIELRPKDPPLVLNALVWSYCKRLGMDAKLMFPNGAKIAIVNFCYSREIKPIAFRNNIFDIFTFSYTKYTKRKYCNRQKIRTRDFDGSPRFRPP